MQLEAKSEKSTHFLFSPNLGRLVLHEPIIRYCGMPVAVIKHQSVLIIDGVCAVYMGSLLALNAVPSIPPVMPSKPIVPPFSPAEILAEAPFDDARTDLILQSSDKVNFHVFKNILSLASPIFTDMFNLPSPPSDKPHDEVQVVSLSEGSTALDVALRHIFPVRNPKGDKLHYASILAEFARKYQVEALEEFTTGYLTDSIERDPVGVYAIAVTYGYHDVGEKAARSCLNLPFSGLRSPYLRCITAEHLSELHRYHVACAEAASALASSDRTWFSLLAPNGIFSPFYTNEATSTPKGSRGGTATCSCTMPDFIRQTATSESPDGAVFYVSDETRSGPRCLWNYLHRSSLVLAHHPSSEAITMKAFVLKSNDCRSCAQYRRGHMLELSVVLGEEVKKAIERVSLLLYPLSHVCNDGECSYVTGALTQGCFRGTEQRRYCYYYKLIRGCKYKNGHLLFSKVRRHFGIAW